MSTYWSKIGYVQMVDNIKLGNKEFFYFFIFFFLMIRRPPRSTPLYSSAASDVYKRQIQQLIRSQRIKCETKTKSPALKSCPQRRGICTRVYTTTPVSYTHLRAHETPEHLVCRLLLEKKKHTQVSSTLNTYTFLSHLKSIPST